MTSHGTYPSSTYRIDRGTERTVQSGRSGFQGVSGGGLDGQEVRSLRGDSHLGRSKPWIRMLSSRARVAHELICSIGPSEERVFRVIESTRPNLLLVFKGETFPWSVAKRASRELGSSTVLWFPDDPRYLRSLLYPQAPFFDHVVTSSKPTSKMLETMGVSSSHIPFGCDPSIHCSAQLEPRYNVTFIGSYYPERARILSGLARNDIAIWGPYWNLPIVSRRLRKSVKHGESHRERYVKLLNSSKISINIHNESDRAVGKVNMRVFETAGCGTFQLTEDSTELDEYFLKGKEVVPYGSQHELCELVDYYLDNEEEREGIALSAQQRAYRDHTYAHRVRLLLSHLGLAMC